MSKRLGEVSANGVHFAYHEEGKGPLVLLLHGFPDTPHTWDRVRPALATQGFRVVAPFMRGYAPTEIPEDGAYDGDTLGADVIALIEALGAKRAVVVGHDWGAVASFCAVGIAPEKVRLLVTMGIPHPASVIPTPRMMMAIRHFWPLSRPGAAQKIKDGGFALIDELVQRWSPAWTVPPGETDAVKRTFSAPGCLEAALGYYRAARPWLPKSQKAKVSVPAVAFAGLHDTIAASTYDRARRRYTDTYEVVKMPGGHFMHREHSEYFIEQLSRVLMPYVRESSGA